MSQTTNTEDLQQTITSCTVAGGLGSSEPSLCHQTRLATGL